MSWIWYVVKHVPDLARAEPRNIGVILFSENHGLSRFVGEAADTGDIDGRTVPQFGHHLVYKAWVRQWRLLSAQGPEAVDIAARQGRRAGDSFFIAQGGQQLIGEAWAPAEEFLEDLFATLVRPDVAPPVADDVRALSQRLFRRLGLSRQVQERVSLPVDRLGIPDDLWFDYRYDNGQPHFLQRVGLAAADKSTWDRLHLVETTFERLREIPNYANVSAVALIKEQNADTRLVRAVRGRLTEVAELVDVSNQDQAAEDLARLFHT